MDRRAASLIGLGLGAGTMYLLDPTAGRRRRALVRDQIVHWSRRSGRAIDATSRDVSNRLHGMGLAARRWWRRVPPGEAAVEQQVRERIAAAVSHPRSIYVRVDDGVVTLSGPILRPEVDPLLAAVERIPGVRSIDHDLQRFDDAADISGLQGAAAQRSARRGFAAREVWPPSLRLAAGALGGALLVTGASRRTGAGLATAALGMGLLARSATNMPLRRLTGIGAGRYAVELQKTIHIGAPVDRVFEIWAAYENFPRFMSHVREVRTLGPRRSRWVVSGPAGVPVEWEAETTAYVPRKVLGWRTVPGSIIQHGGLVRFDEENGGTRVTLRMSYNPGAGAVGHALAEVLGTDPKTRLDQDLVMMKTYIETGSTPHMTSR